MALIISHMQRTLSRCGHWLSREKAFLHPRASKSWDQTTDIYKKNHVFHGGMEQGGNGNSQDYGNTKGRIFPKRPSQGCKIEKVGEQARRKVVSLARHDQSLQEGML